MISTRMIEIIEYLLKNKKSSFKDIGKNLGHKERTIRYDILKINDILELNNLPLIQKKSKGILVFPENVNIQSLIIQRDYIYSQQERVYLMEFILFYQGELFKLNKFMDDFNVSRSTIKSDLKIIENYLDNFNLRLEYNSVFNITGHQKNIVLARRQILIRAIYLFTSKVTEKNMYECKCINIIEKIFEGINIKKVISFIDELLKELNCVLTDNSYRWYTTGILALLWYIKNKEDYPLDELECYFVDTSFYGEKYSDFVLKLEESFSIKFTEKNVKTVMWLLNYTNKYSITFSKEYDYIDIETIIIRLLELMSEEMKNPFEKDLILFEGLLNHIIPLLKRIEENIVIKDDVISLLSIKDLEVCQIVSSVLSKIRLFSNIKDNNEIAYIAIHFIASIKRNKVVVTKNIILVCGFGYGTTIMLKESLLEDYEVNIINTMPSYMVKHFCEWDTVDAIITTNDLDFNTVKPIIKVNPILSFDDHIKLKSVGFNNKKISHRYNEINSKIGFLTDEQRLKVMDVIRNEVGCGDVNFDYKINKLTDILESSFIKYIDYDILYKDAIYISSEILENKGLITLKYKETIVQTFEKLGFYSIIDKNVALLHSGKTECVNKSCISLLVTKKPVSFGEKNVNVIFCLASKDGKEHIPAIVTLMRIIKNTGFIYSILGQSNENDIYNIIKKYENEVTY